MAGERALASARSRGFCRSSVQPKEASVQASFLVPLRFQSKLKERKVGGTVAVGTSVYGANITCAPAATLPLI